MPFTLDPELAAGFAALTEEIGEVEPMAAGDVASRRKVYDDLQRTIHSRLPATTDVTITDHETTTADGARLLLRWYAEPGRTPDRPSSTPTAAGCA